MERMRILVTGAAGFIGSNLSTALIKKGWTVVGLDNLSQGSQLNLHAIEQHQKFHFVLGDIRDEKAVTNAMKGCSHVVHLAAYKIPRYDDALDTLLINSFGSDVIFRVAAKLGVKVVAASTSDVYGKNPDLPFHEESSLVIGGPSVKRWSYAVSKMFEEQLLYAYHQRSQVGFAIVRFFGVYGPNQNLTWWGGPQSVFINHALKGEAIPVHGDGLQSRSFTFISDAVDAVLRCIEIQSPINTVVNIGHTEEIKIIDLAHLIWRLVRGEDQTKIQMVPYESFGKYEDVRARRPDLTRAQALLGFHPKISLIDGLKKTIAWQVMRLEEMARASRHPATGQISSVKTA